MTTGAMQKRKYIPGQSGLRKCQKNTEKLQRSTLPSYQQFIKVFSAQGNRINVLSFSMCQASRVTRYKFGVSTKSTEGLGVSQCIQFSKGTHVDKNTDFIKTYFLFKYRPNTVPTSAH